MQKYKAEDLEKMARPDLIKVIQPIAHPQTFHQMLKWPTEALRFYIIDMQNVDSKLKGDAN